MTRAPMNTDDIRATLEARLAVLLERATRIEAHEREIGREVPSDSEDRAQYREDDEVVERLGDMTASEIAEIRASLQRLEDGTYGKCGDCGAAIERSRLRAVMTSPWCGDCARRREASPA